MSDRGMAWLLLPAACVACGGSPAVSEPAAPSEPPPSVASNPAPAPVVAPSAPAVADAPPFPPAPWVIAASAPSERSFVRYELEGATLWVACYGEADICLQPELAIERADRLEPTAALASGMPELTYIDLREEPEGHWKTVGHKAKGPPPGQCKDQTYVGPRGMTGLYGRFPDDVWMTVDRSGEEHVMSSVTSVFRFQGKQWQHVRTQPQVGDRVARLFRWRGAMLGVVERQGLPFRFETFGARQGMAAPRVNSARLDQIVVRGDNAIVATTTESPITLVGWAPGATQPVSITLRATLEGERDEIGKLVVTEAGDVDVFGFGELPIQARAAQDFRVDKLRATLRFAGGRWKVVEQKLDDWHDGPASSEAPAPVALGQGGRFFVHKTFVTPDGSRWVEGRADERVLLLRDRPIQAEWRTSDAQVVEVPPKIDPSCSGATPWP